LAIEKALTDMPMSSSDFMDEEISIEVVNPDSITIESEDGGMIIDFDPDESLAGDEFDSNLAEFMDDQDLTRLSSELVGAFLSDKGSRKDWEETYIKGLKQLGLKIEDRTSPWEGACGVTHPILSEAVVRFQSQAIGEIFPAAGPVSTKIVGRITDEKAKQAARVQEFMNYMVTEVMTEYRAETEKMLFSLPLAGSAFRKVYWDANMGRPCAMFVPAEDLVVSYGASTLETAERITHVMKRNRNDVRKSQVNGFYADVDIDPDNGSISDIQEEYDDLTGESPGFEKDSRCTLLEIQTDIDLAGFEHTKDGEETGIALPYVVTIDKGSRKVLSIRRNWLEDDENYTPRQHFVSYEYIPGLGFYGFGLIHMIGGIAKSATSILRQLVDAGTLSNLPGGLKSRGLRIRGDDTPITPGEFRDVDVPSGAIRDNIQFLPYKEPSGVLYQLLGNIVEEGRRFASLTDLQISDMNQQAPVGTTLALLERSMKVMSAVQARLHSAMKKEFEILADIVKDYAPHSYPYDQDGNEMMSQTDFDDRIDVIPVSDPNSATMAQRIMQYQAALQLAGTAPQMYDMPLLHRQMLDVLGIKDPDQIIPLKDEVEARDPVTENMEVLNNKPVKAFQWQDHESHIQTHISAVQNPQILEMVSKSPSAKAIEAAMAAHITEHIAFQYRSEIEKQLGAPLPPLDEDLPPEIENQLSALVAQASEKVLQQSMAQAQQQKNQEQAEDPIVQMRQKELQIREMETMANIEEKKARLQLDREKMRERNDVELTRISTNKMISEENNDVEIAKSEMDAAVDLAENESREKIEAMKADLEILKNTE
jgi:hypothetical protein